MASNGKATSNFTRGLRDPGRTTPLRHYPLIKEAKKKNRFSITKEAKAKNEIQLLEQFDFAIAGRLRRRNYRMQTAERPPAQHQDGCQRAHPRVQSHLLF